MASDRREQDRLHFSIWVTLIGLLFQFFLLPSRFVLACWQVAQADAALVGWACPALETALRTSLEASEPTVVSFCPKHATRFAAHHHSVPCQMSFAPSKRLGASPSARRCTLAQATFGAASHCQGLLPTPADEASRAALLQWLKNILLTRFSGLSIEARAQCHVETIPPRRIVLPGSAAVSGADITAPILRHRYHVQQGGRRRAPQLS